MKTWNLCREPQSDPEGVSAFQASMRTTITGTIVVRIVSPHAGKLLETALELVLAYAAHADIALEKGLPANVVAAT